MLLSGRIRLIVLFSAAIPAVRAAERTIERVYSVADGATLNLDTYRGAIDVKQSDDSRIHVKILEQIFAFESPEADPIFKRVEIEEKADAHAVSIVVRNPFETRVRFVWSEKEHIVIGCSILVPKTCNLVLATNDGGMTVDNLSGNIDARAKKGTVFFRRIEGDIRAEADDGDMIISRCMGSVDLRARTGNIRVGTIARHGIVRTLNGDIDVGHALGGLVASAEAGNVTIGFEKEFPENVKIETNGGAINVQLDPGTRCRIKASSVWGRVHATLPLSVKSGGDGERSLDALFNGGGPLLLLHANGGQVHIALPRF
jgi:DUF4097 and DUF4098 domain-containing protein YvlB